MATPKAHPFRPSGGPICRASSGHAASAGVVGTCGGTWLYEIIAHTEDPLVLLDATMAAHHRLVGMMSDE